MSTYFDIRTRSKRIEWSAAGAYRTPFGACETTAQLARLASAGSTGAHAPSQPGGEDTR